MKKFLIERDVPGLGQFSASELQIISQKSCNVVKEIEEPYQWVQSFITGDKMYCIHIAKDEEAVREHARMGGFPIGAVSEIVSIIDPITAE